MNGSLNELSRGLRNVSTSFALAKPLRISSRAMHAEPQTSFHEIGPPFSSSAGAMIHRVCTDYLNRAKVSDKKQGQFAFYRFYLYLDKRLRPVERTNMRKAILIVSIGAVAAMTGVLQAVSSAVQTINLPLLRKITID